VFTPDVDLVLGLQRREYAFESRCIYSNVGSEADWAKILGRSSPVRAEVLAPSADAAALPKVGNGPREREPALQVAPLPDEERLVANSTTLTRSRFADVVRGPV